MPRPRRSRTTGAGQMSAYPELRKLQDIIDNPADRILDQADRIEALKAALNYVADMTYCGADAEWHFKPGYDPQAVLDALAPEQEK